MNELEMETMGMECRLVCQTEPEINVTEPASWGGTDLSTSAVWGGRIAAWDTTGTSEDSPVGLTSAVWGATTGN